LKKRAIKVFTFFAAVLILTTAASYFFINGYIYPLIITSTKRIINEFTGGETEIGKVELSLFPPGIEMSEITFLIEEKEKAVFHLKKIRAELNPIQAFSGTININRISVIEPELDAFSGALPEKFRRDDTVKDKLQPEFFKASIREISVEKGHFIIRLSEDEFIEIEEAYISTSKTDTGSDTFTINAAKGKVAMKGRQEDFSGIKVEGTKDEAKIKLHNISISPEWSTLSGSATIGIKPLKYVKGSIRGKIPFNRVSRYIKKELPFKGQGDFAAHFSYNNNKADLKASLVYDKKKKPLQIDTSLQFLHKEIKLRKGELIADNLDVSLKGSIFPDNKIDLRARLAFGNLSGLLSPFMSPVPKGSFATEGKIEGSLSKPEVKTAIKAVNIAYGKYNAEELTGALNYGDKKLWTEEIKMSRGKATVSVGGSLSFSDKAPLESDIRIEVPFCKISELLAIGGKDFPMEGQIKSRLNMVGNIENPAISGEFIISEGELFGERADHVKLKGKYLDNSFTIEEFLLYKSRSTVRARGAILSGGEINVTFEANRIDLARINHIDNKVEGIVNLKGKVEGNLSAPIVRASLLAEKLKSSKSPVFADLGGDLYAKINPTEPDKQKISYSSSKLQFVLSDENRISLTPFTLKFNKGLFSFSRTSFSDRYGSVSMKGSLSVDGKADISLIAIAQLEGLENKLKGVEDIEGRVDVDVKISGKITKPLLEGAMKAQKGMVRFKGFPYDMNAIFGKLKLIGNRITIDNLKGKLEGSDFTGGGHLVFDGYKPSEIKLYFDVEEVDLTIPRWLPSRSKGRVTVTATGKEVTLGGDIEVIRASYTDQLEFKGFLAKMVKLIDTKEINAKTGNKTDKGKLNVKIHFRADDNLIIKNNLSNMELKGDLILIGKGGKLSLIGKLETIGGKGYFRNREFSISKGTVDFTNREKIVPVVNIDAETSIKDYLVNVNVTGPPKNLVFTLNSDPPLEEKEIVSLVTFGYTGDELRGKGTEITSLGAASLILQEDIEATIKQYFGFDRLRIEPYYSETAETTEARITVDKDLGKNTTATYSRGMSTLDEEVKVEYKLDDNLSFEGSWASTEETVGAFGGDVILRFEFE